MIEKIDKIQALLNVPNVDADTETAITNMKILNLLVDLRAEAEQLILSGLVGSYDDMTFAELSKIRKERISELKQVDKKMKELEIAIGRSNDMEDKIFDIVTDLIRDDISKNEAIGKLLYLYGVMPRISHFVSDIGQKYSATDEAILIEIEDGILRFYELGYNFERIYLTPVYMA